MFYFLTVQFSRINFFLLFSTSFKVNRDIFYHHSFYLSSTFFIFFKIYFFKYLFFLTTNIYYTLFLFFVKYFFKYFSKKRRRWDLNPRTATNDLPAFQASPFNHLGTSPNTLNKIDMAERVGFEPTAPCGVTGFQDQLLKPLGHLSILFSLLLFSS